MYNNFSIASYAHAEFLADANEEEIKKQLDFFDEYIGGLDKVYLELHRGEHNVSKSKIKKFIKIFSSRGVKLAGGITATTDLDDDVKHRIFDVYCYSSNKFIEQFKKVVEETALLFDEFILDDFFFTSCRCDECIKAKGDMSWAEYRLKLMEKMSHIVSETAKKVNPKCKCVIKYPNWFESWQETGYNPEKEKDIFDAIYTAAESRNPSMSQQHIQRYLSYSLIRYVENIAPGKNGGGWIDTGDTTNNINWYIEQVLLAIYSKTKEICLFGFGGLVDSPYLPALGSQLRIVDKLVDYTGEANGVSTYHPFNADCGEDQLYNYIAMLGIPLEPTPYFQNNQDVIFLTASAAKDKNIMKKLKTYVKNGGKAIITSGLLNKLSEKGIKDMTSAQCTNRIAKGNYFCTDPYIGNRREFCYGKKDITLHAINYKTNATWSDSEMICEKDNYPMILRDDYGMGELYIVNIPDNFSDLYNLPVPVMTLMRKMFSKGQRAYIESEDMYNLFLYDNDTFIIQSYREYREYMKVVIKGECESITDLKTNKEYEPIAIKEKPEKRFDVAYVPDSPKETVFEVYFMPGTYKFFRINIKK